MPVYDAVRLGTTALWSVCIMHCFSESLSLEFQERKIFSIEMKPGVFFSVVLYAFAGAVFTAAGVNQPGVKVIDHFVPQHAMLTVPVLCYHNIKANSAGHNTLYTISINR